MPAYNIHRYYNKEGEPITMREWLRLHGNMKYRRIALDETSVVRASGSRESVEVSTVWLGMDHGFGCEPLIFETMIFGGPHDVYQERYATLEEAKAGHKRACKLVGIQC